MKFHHAAWPILLLSNPVSAQFFNLPAFVMVAIVGQKQACTKAFPDLAPQLQASFNEMAKRNKDVMPVESFTKMETITDFTESELFAKADREACASLIKSMPEFSLQKAIDEQERINEGRRLRERQ